MLKFSVMPLAALCGRLCFMCHHSPLHRLRSASGCKISIEISAHIQHFAPQLMERDFYLASTGPVRQRLIVNAKVGSSFSTCKAVS